FAIALWNGRDPILKERLFGLAGPEGNHGEDVKEYYFYLDNTPSHSYMKMLYRYPQAAFPYADLVAENGRRGRHDFEYELMDAGAFEGERYFDVVVEYAKAGQDDILIRITVTNQGPEEAICHLLPTVWFRNTWSWGYPAGPMNCTPGKPVLRKMEGPAGSAAIAVDHPAAGNYFLYAERALELLFTENETNMERLFDSANDSPYVKDAFHRTVIGRESGAVNPAQEGTKGAAWYHDAIPAGRSISYRLRLADAEQASPFGDFDDIFDQRLDEADAFYDAVHPADLDAEDRLIQRQAFAGLLWTKQLYYYDIPQWLRGDPRYPPPPFNRKQGRNREGIHLNNLDILSMPD
ncbi:MAG: glucosidase, partial [Pseudomonadota bacterium]